VFVIQSVFNLYCICIASVFVVEIMCECNAANRGVFLRYSIKESKRHLSRNLMVSESAPDEWRRTQAPTRME